MRTISDEKIIEWLEENGKETFCYEEIADQFEETLNEVYGTVNICGQDFDAGTAYRELDPIGFRCGVSDWSSEEFEEICGGYAYKSDYNDAVEALSEEESED